LPPTPLPYKGRGVLKPLSVSGRGLERGLFSFLEMSTDEFLTQNFIITSNK
jgi:hypothetical protein